MTDDEPQYEIVLRRGLFYVLTSGLEATIGTREKATAEGWARNLRRAAQIESERKRMARGGR